MKPEGLPRWRERRQRCDGEQHVIAKVLMDSYTPARSDWQQPERLGGKAAVGDVRAFGFFDKPESLA